MGNMSNVLNPMSAVNYLNQMDIMRQYQSNLTSLSNLAGFANVNSTPPSTTSSSTPGSLTVQQLLNMSSNAAPSRTSMHHQQPKATTTTSTTKEAPSISITPVGSGLHKTKSSKHSHPEPLPAHSSKALPGTKTIHSTPAQVSLLKPSVIAQTKTAPPKQMTAPQLRVSKTLNEPQPAHNSSHSALGGNTAVSGPPQIAHSSIQGQGMMGMGMPTARAGTSLQHKLLSKKMPPQSTKTTNLGKKIKTTKNLPQLPNNLQNLLNMAGAGALAQQNFLTPDLGGISVSPVGGSVTKPPPPPKHPPYRKVGKKTAEGQNSGGSGGNTAETLSMLSQLQQHSHLEIIPQAKGGQKGNQMDFAKNLPVSLSVVPPQKISSEIRPTSTDCMSVFELPRGKSGTTAKKADKAKDSVEIITLDD